MKRYLTGIVAILFAVGMSSFTASDSKEKTEKSPTSYYWFRVASGYGDLNSLTNAEISEYMGFSAVAPTSGCEGTGFHCIVGFNADDVDIPNEELKSGNHTLDHTGTPRAPK